ncbi:MAG: beta strand repeat-containing protein [Candidatus Kapaibacteriales bacterium]
MKMTNVQQTLKEGDMPRIQTKIRTLLAVVLVLAFALSELLAQDFTNNTGGTYQVGPNGGTIRMRSSGGQFNGTAPYGTATNPVPGTVIWYCDQPMNVGVGGPYYYTNLGTNGSGTKTFKTSAYILGNYTPQGGNRDYSTHAVTINYIGTSGSQTIAGENNTNGTGYYSLVLSGASTKEIATGSTVLVTNYFDLDNTSGALTNNGTMNLNNTQASNAAANITNNGTWNFNGSGTFTSAADFTNNATGAGGGVFVSGSGAVTFNNFTNTDGAFNIAANSTVYMNGSFTRTSGNISFDCASNFHYSGGAQTILGNNATYFPSYGNLFLAGTGDKTAGGDVSVCNNLTVSREVDMAPGANDYILTMLNTNGNASATYNNNVEVRGKFRWQNLTAGTQYTFNNANTQVTFSAVPTWFQLDIRQQTNPTNLNNFNVQTDVRRAITANFNGTGTISALNISYESTDLGGSFNGNENIMRYAEGYSSTANHQKLIRSGATYTRNISVNPRTIAYAGGSGPGISLISSGGGGTVYELSDGSNIVLTTVPITIVSVTNGRWTNPGTWDIGAVPTANDDVEIRHVVWTGIDQAVFGGSAWTDDEVDGSNNGDAGAAANRITIANVSGATLVIGNQDATMGNAERIFRTRLVAASGAQTPGIFNLNTNANTGDGDGTSATGLNGIWVRTPGQFTPVLGTLQLTNQGSIMNRSILEIGICQ